MFLKSARGLIGPLYIAVVLSDFEYKLANEDGSTYWEGNKDRFHQKDLKSAVLNPVPGP